MDVFSLLYWDVGSHFSWFALSILRSSEQWLASTVIGLHVLPLLNSGAECFLSFLSLAYNHRLSEKTTKLLDPYIASRV